MVAGGKDSPGSLGAHLHREDPERRDGRVHAADAGENGRDAQRSTKNDGADDGGARGGGRPRENTVKVCITKEDAELDYVPQKEKCRQKVVERTSNTLKIRFDCPGDPPTSGESEITLLGPKAYTGRTTIDTRVDGKPERMEMSQTGKWLSEDCGNVKPYRRP